MDIKKLMKLVKNIKPEEINKEFVRKIRDSIPITMEKLQDA